MNSYINMGFENLQSALDQGLQYAKIQKPDLIDEFGSYWTSLSNEEKECILTIDEIDIVNEFWNALIDFSSRTRADPERLKATFIYPRPNKPTLILSIIHLNRLRGMLNNSLYQDYLGSAVILMVEDNEALAQESANVEKLGQHTIIEEELLQTYIHDIEMLEKNKMLFKIKYSDLDSIVETFRELKSFENGQASVISKDQYKNYFFQSYKNAMMRSYSLTFYNRKDPTNCQLKVAAYLNSLMTLLENNTRRAYQKAVPVKFEYIMEQFPQRTPSPLVQQFYYHDQSFRIYSPQMSGQIYEGIHFGKLSFTIKHEPVEEDEYTGISQTNYLRRHSDETKGRDSEPFNGHSGRLRYNSGSYQSKNFFVPEQNGIMHPIAQPVIQQQDMHALAFLLGTKSPFVIMNQQKQQPFATPTKPVLTTQSPPLLQDVINLGISSQITNGNSFHDSKKFSFAPILGHNGDLKNESIPKTPEKDALNRNTLEKRFEGAASELENTAKTNGKISPQGKTQKKLKYKPNDKDSNGINSWENGYQANGMSTTPKSQQSLLFGSNNTELFPSLDEANNSLTKKDFKLTFCTK